jgi:hypothetical protein
MLTRPIQGYVVDWDAQKAVWDGVLSNEVLNVHSIPLDDAFATHCRA